MLWWTERDEEDMEKMYDRALSERNYVIVQIVKKSNSVQLKFNLKLTIVKCFTKLCDISS